MEEVLRWLDIQVRRENRTPHLEDALLGERFPGYAFYRLRYFLLRFLTGSLVHAMRFVLILHVASGHGFLGILALHASVSLAGSAWWGLLEEMRGRVRFLRRAGKPYLIPKELRRWLALSIQLAVLVAGGGLAWFLADTAVQGRAPTVLEVYALTVLLGFALNLATRCYHSGIYALRRVYRPPIVIILVEVVSFATLLALWPVLGSWSLPLASFLSTLTVAVLTVYYAWRAYSFFGIHPLVRMHFSRFRPPRTIATREAAAGAVAFGLMRLDSLLILTLFLLGHGERDKLVLLLFLLSPVIHAALDWARLFYFDLKRLEIRFFKNIRRRFQRAVVGLAALLGIGFWLFSLPYGWILGRNLEALALPLGLFLASRSLLAAYQIQMFSEKAYRDVVVSGIALLGGFSLLAAVRDPGERLLVLSLLNLGTMAFLWWRSRQLGPGFWGRPLLWPSEWLAEVAASNQPIRISSGRMLPPPIREASSQEADRSPIPWMTRQIIERIGHRLRRRGRVTYFSPDRLVWYEQGTGRRRTGCSWFVWQGSGLVRWMGTSGKRVNGMRALEAASTRRLLGPLARSLLTCPKEPVSMNEVKEEFRSLCPRGIIYDPARPVPHALKTMEPRERRRILFAAGSYLKVLRPESFGSRYEVTALCAHGELSLIFVVPRRRDSDTQHKRWRHRVRQYNMQAGIWGASENGTDA